MAPQAALEKERRAALEAQKSMQQLEPLRIRLIPVNYALASEVSDKIKDVLSDRGVVTVDARTNVLIVKDVSENLTKVVSTHTFKMGYELMRTRADIFNQSLPGGVYRFGGTALPFTQHWRSVTRGAPMSR